MVRKTRIAGVDPEAVGRDAHQLDEDQQTDGVRREGGVAHVAPAPAGPAHPLRADDAVAGLLGEVGRGHPAMLTGERSQTRLGAMSTRAQRYDAVVLSRARISAAPAPADPLGARSGVHRDRRRVGRTGGAGTVPGALLHGALAATATASSSTSSSTTRAWSPEWATGDCEGDRVVITGAQGSFEPPADAAWLLLVGDLTAMPAMARIACSRRSSGSTTRIWAEVPDDLTGYLPDGVDVTWLEPPAEGQSRLAEVVEAHRLARGRGLLLDGRRVRADAGDPQAPDARAAAARARRTT